MQKMTISMDKLCLLYNIHSIYINLKRRLCGGFENTPSDKNMLVKVDHETLGLGCKQIVEDIT